MKLTFLGMSGVGKSHWAKLLAQNGWLHLDCDAMIAQRLGELIDVADDEDAVHAVGRWMGMPWEAGYAQREEQYLDLEREVTSAALDTAAAQSSDRNIVLDTTGSVIYTGEALLERLRCAMRIVYFEVPEDVKQAMVDLYRREPKPLLWRGGYQQAEGESQDDALARCYAELLDCRAAQYEQYADVTVPYHTARATDFDLLESITA